MDAQKFRAIEKLGKKPRRRRNACEYGWKWIHFLNQNLKVILACYIESKPTDAMFVWMRQLQDRDEEKTSGMQANLSWKISTKYLIEDCQ